VRYARCKVCVVGQVGEEDSGLLQWEFWLADPGVPGKTGGDRASDLGESDEAEDEGEEEGEGAQRDE
jgi:hypothetical protein